MLAFTTYGRSVDVRARAKDGFTRPNGSTRQLTRYFVGSCRLEMVIKERNFFCALLYIGHIYFCIA